MLLWDVAGAAQADGAAAGLAAQGNDLVAAMDWVVAVMATGLAAWAAWAAVAPAVATVAVEAAGLAAWAAVVRAGLAAAASVAAEQRS